MSNRSKQLRTGLGILTGLLVAAGVVGFIFLALAMHT